ncbi:hypothetical protein SAMN05444360_120104 [Chryseobacterium carnipullorum]|uniref:hypothetical protein n=1 Tax=Chryseobacterium carnipullorum TaxID=1124835 RepID=UPI00090ED874|nr:hypothetical protein [Chryseobacterium carnipullorum]SHM89247.1 hypothetical protein SAMN05444360_120104 [Chryseobacterium carnipullorum]
MKKQIILLLLTLITISVFAQSVTSNINKFEITPKTPDASQLSKFTDIPNATFTGTAGVNIPIYTINTGEYQLPVDLKYHVSGIRVNEVSTKVGLGWSLAMGGISLSKQIFGRDDRGWIPYVNPSSFHPDYNETDNGLASYITGFDAMNPNNTAKKKYDSQPDIYSYSIGKFSGEFYLSSTGQVIQVPYNNIKIALQGGLFEITDDQGIKYMFSGANQTRSLGGSIPETEDYRLLTTDYKIDKIELPSGKSIRFNYSNTQYNYLSNNNKRQEISENCQGIIESKVYREYTTTTYVFRESVINSIEFDSQRIEFNYSNDRQDITNGLSLNEITVKNGGNIISKFNLIKDYFPENTNEGPNVYDASLSKRLRLKEVINVNDGSKYRLFYHEQHNLPNRFSDATDHLGFYNGSDSNKGIPSTYYKGVIYGDGSNKEPNLEYAISGSLKKIQYPTGGSMEIEYEDDDYYGETEVVKFEKKNTGTWSDVDYVAEFQVNNVVSPYDDKILFETNFESAVNPPNDSNVLPQGSHFVADILDPNNVILASFTFTGAGTALVDKKSSYKIRIRKVKRPSQFPINLDDYVASIQLAWFEKKTEFKKGNLKVGGLRIKKLVKKDENNLIASSVKYNYKDENGKSTGLYVGDNIDYTYSSPVAKNINDQGNTVCSIVVVSNTGKFNTSTINGKPIVYSKVETEYLGGQENYKVVDTYLNINGQNPIGLSSSMFTYFDNKFTLGLPSKKEYYNSSSILLKSIDTEYEYDNYFNQFSNDYNPSYPNLVIMPYFILIKSYALFVMITGMPNSYRANYYIDRYQISSTWVKQKKTLSKTYFNNQQISELTELFYDPTYKHLSPIRQKITFSDAKVNETSYAYAHEKGNQKLINAHMIGIPLATEIKENGKVINKSETKYDSSIHLFPTSALSFDLQNPVTGSTELSYDQYDNKGNLQQYTARNGISTTIIWGYNQTQPIAKIEGAKLSDIPQALIDSIVSASVNDAQLSTDASEQLLISALDVFRNNAALSAYQISTYSYDPLIGVKSITPPSGIREFYIYDTANRLKEVRENSPTGKILKEYKYNYKN